jgi:hypothetical protein
MRIVCDRRRRRRRRQQAEQRIDAEDARQVASCERLTGEQFLDDFEQRVLVEQPGVVRPHQRGVEQRVERGTVAGHRHAPTASM